MRTNKRRQIPIRLAYGFPIQMLFYTIYDQLEPTLVTVIPEVQPQLHLLDKIICIGSCFNESIRSLESGANEEGPLKKLIDSFEPVNPINLVDNFLPNNFKLPVS
jgi:hypothetical protein